MSAAQPPAATEPVWNYATLWEIAAGEAGDRPAVVQGERRVSWSSFERRANGLAAAFLDAGAQHQDKVAQYLGNCSEYLETVFACFKAGLVPVNTNPRYTEDELTYLWTSADVTAVVFHGAFADAVERVRPRVPAVHQWVWVDDGSGRCPDWASRYEDCASSGGDTPIRGPWGRSEDDLNLLYTGGTTGYPKGVMWRQGDLTRLLVRYSKIQFPPDSTTSTVRQMLVGPGPVSMAACPLSHGTGLHAAFCCLASAGTVVLLSNRSYSAIELLDAAHRERVEAISIVGDAYARPLLEALDANPGQWELSRLKVLTSSGVVWSQEVKQRLLTHLPHIRLVDSLGSSEAVGAASSVTRASDGPGRTGSFKLSDAARIISQDGCLLPPGSAEPGLLALSGAIPLGYYNDPEGTAQTFRTIDGVRYSLPGDWVTAEPDGTLRLLGRGSVCINTAGEKVFPEEVEEVLKRSPAVRDALVVGIPDDKFGERVCAVIEADSFSEDELRESARAALAGYKIPRFMMRVDDLGRADSGKADYRRWRLAAIERFHDSQLSTQVSEAKP